MRYLARLMVYCATGVAVVATVSGVAAAAGGLHLVGDQPTEDAGSIVEDFRYPDAEEIRQRHNIKLIAGDGQILFADCATPPVGDIGVIKVRATKEIGPENRGLVCFKVLRAPGRLDLEIPAVYEIRGDGQRPGTGHEATAKLTTDDGERTTVEINPSGSTPVGIGADPNNDPTTLLQLRVTG
jgi:hypothetical protein